jgi:uncharacterized delta-60 repeat protein
MSTVNESPVLTTGAGNGIVTLDLGAFSSDAASLALQADGKVVVRADAWNLSATAEYSVLIRYNADGSLDTAFGTKGVVASRSSDLTISPGPEAGVALQADGKIVTGGDFLAVARYNSDGSLDTSFGTGGKIPASMTSAWFSYGIVVEPDGKIVASADNSSFGLARFDSSGHLDSSFGTGGRVATSFGGSVSLQANSLFSQPDGKLVVAGSVSSGHTDFALVRYNSDGSLDAGFGSGGKVTTDFSSGTDTAFSATIQADGKIVAAGSTDSRSFALARYNVDGSLDGSFGTGGKVATDLGTTFLEAAESVKIQADGKIVVAGYTFVGSRSEFALVRYNSDGTLDSTFGTGGKVLTDAGSANDTVTGLEIQPDGKILVVGTSSGTGVSPADIVLVRYNSDGSLDTSFGAASALDGPAFFIEDQAPTVLNPHATVHDTELAATDNYAGASLTLARHGGANSEDVFGATGNLAALAEGGNITLSGIAIGTVTQNSAGMLVLTYGAAATEARVDEAMRDITYVNTSDTPAASARIDWSFSDGNAGAQGSGGALTATGATTLNITPFNDAPVNTVPGALGTLADTDLAIAGLSISDPDSASLTTMLSVDHGTLNVAAAGGATVFGNGTDQVWITGSVAQINATLGASNNVLYHSAADFSGTDTLTMRTSDGVGAGSSTVSSTVALNVTTVPGSLAISDVTVSEGDSGSKVATFTVTRSGGTAPIAVDFATADGSATTADNDYVAASGTLNFAQGDKAKTFGVTINGDTKFEADETFSVHLSGATNGAAISDDVGAGTIGNDDVVGSVAINDVTVAEGDSGSKVATFTVTRSGGAIAFDVDFATADGTATIADHDYVATAGTLHFDAGINSQTIPVTVNGDTTFEPNETFSVQLSGATNAGTVADGSGTGTISNDDAAGSIAIDDVTVTEGDSGSKVATFTVTRNGGASPFDVNFATADGSAAVADHDYVATAGTLHFDSGVNSQTISVTVNGDTTVEPDETFFLQLSGATNDGAIADGVGTGTISNDDAVGSIAIDDVTITEGDSGSKFAMFTVTRSGGASPFDVNFATADGTATSADLDYVPTAGTLHFGAGVNSQTISVMVDGDPKFEPGETFSVNLSGASNGGTIADGVGTGTISNDDATGSIAINDVTVTEDDSGNKAATFTVTRSGGASPFDVDYATADGTATTTDHDYVGTAATLHFGTGVNSQTVSVAVLGDTTFEPNETFFLQLSGATNGGAIADSVGTGTISNDDAVGSIAINDVTITEGDSGNKLATFTVTRSGGASPFDVDFATADGAATIADHDYVASSGTLHFGPRANIQTISVTINGDTTFEPDESFSIDLSGATNGGNIVDSLGTATISNDDAVGSIAINDVTITEGDSGGKLATFTVTRSGGASAFDVDFATADGTAAIADHDYAATAGTLHFGAGVNSQTISVAVNGDTTFEPNETFSLHLSNATNGGTIADSMGIGTVQNDDVNRASDDFNADGISDVLWRDNSGGDVGIWVMKDGPQNWQDLGGSGTDHKIAGTGDFNGDGTSDVLWRNDTTGHVGIWEMHNDVPAWHDLGGSGTDHKVVGVGDLNGDGTSDVLWRNDASGHTGFWEMHDNVQTWRDLGDSGVDHKVVGVGDFNGDGTSDILWRNDTTGHTGFWEMHNNVQTWRDLGGSGTDHKVVGVGDFNGDGISDILWRNDSTGHVGIWEMQNDAQSWVDLGGSGSDHKVAGIGDYNGDGTSDIFWRNDATGHTGFWEMHNNVPTWHDLGGSGVDHSFIV